jgi:hypothetical protein
MLYFNVIICNIAYRNTKYTKNEDTTIGNETSGYCYFVENNRLR